LRACLCVLTAADEVHHLDCVPILQRRRGVGVALDDDHVALDRDPPRVDVEPRQQRFDIRSILNGNRFTVHENGHLDRSL
jgi:hypothetical protein